MKRRNLLYIISLCIILSSCGMQKFTIGDTSGETIVHEKKKMVHLFIFIPIGRKKEFPMMGEAKGYEIITRYNFWDCVVSGLTVGIVNMKTVKYKATK
jgi:hypothetical protein